MMRSLRRSKSQNPTKRPHLEMEDNDHISSDSASDEGFPDPMMEDDDDDLDNVSSGDEAAWTDLFVLLYSVHSLRSYKFAKQFANCVINWSSDLLIIWSSDCFLCPIICLLDDLMIRPSDCQIRSSLCLIVRLSDSRLSDCLITILSNFMIVLYHPQGEKFLSAKPVA